MLPLLPEERGDLLHVAALVVDVVLDSAAEKGGAEESLLFLTLTRRDFQGRRKTFLLRPFFKKKISSSDVWCLLVWPTRAHTGENND